MTTEAAHSPLGPSAADRWINCPGSVLATAHLPDSDSEYSLLGTAAHSLAERCRKDNVPAAHYMEGKLYVEKVDGSSAEFIVDRNMAESVQAFIDYVNALPGDDYNETRVHYHEWVEGAFGTMDAAKATHHVLHIADYKHGEGVWVGAKENPQLKLYALGWLEYFGWLYDIRKVHLHVVQPRLDNFSTWETDVESLRRWATEVVRPAGQAALTPGAPFKAGAHCKFCKIRATCVTRAKYVFEMNLDELEDLDTAILREPPPIGQLSITQITRALEREPHVKAWYSDVRAHAASELAHGRDVGGWKMVAGKSERNWTLPPTEIEKRMSAAGLGEGIKAKLYTEPEIISPAKAEKVFGKKWFAPGSDTKEGGPLADLVKKTRGKPVLAPPTDDRPPISVDASEMEVVDGTD